MSEEAVKANEACRRIFVTGNLMTDLGRRATGPKIAIDMGSAKESIIKDNDVENGLIVK